MNVTLRAFSHQMFERDSLQKDRTVSERYVRVMFLDGITENNISYISWCQSKESPYTERYSLSRSAEYGGVRGRKIK
ncbi:MAG: hypothetical protein EHM93_10810 [Bacteroidales bacterium]|nr:MAG: hypothetical protein EHM93_10810 [Bacteroidales bacterium]